MLRLICISDTHGLHRQLNLPVGDVLIHAGDLTRDGTLEELRDLNAWLGEQPHAHKVVIAGNHDRICEEVPEYIPDILSNAMYLCDQVCQIAGYSVYGAPWTPGGGGWAFSRSLNALGYCWAQIPENTAILITHGAPLGILDANTKGEHLGDPTLAAALRQLAPRAHIFGHIHESYGTYENYGTMFVNASSCNEHLELVYAPLVVEVG
jgi:Icc-related predicted phosphoesterase